MELETLQNYMITIGQGKRLSAEDKTRISAELPLLIERILASDVPARIAMPTGEKLVSATRITALKCHALLLARKAFGQNFIKTDPAYEDLAKDILFYVMRGYFNGTDVKGHFCCPSCTLSLLPLYTTKCFKWADCDQLAADIREALDNRTGLFERPYPEKYAAWALGVR